MTKGEQNASPMSIPRRSIIRAASVGVFSSVILGSSTAAESPSISYGETVTGVTSDKLTFSAEENDVVSIDLRLNNPIDYEGVISLRRPNGNQIASVEGNAEDGNAALSLHELPRISGEYIIEVEGKYDSGFGYVLSLYSGVPSDQLIDYGESVSGELTRDDRYFNDFYVNGYHDAYAVEASVGDEITIEMRPDNEIDNRAQLVLFDPDDERVDYDIDQRGEDGNAVITQYQVERYQGGEYTIVATGNGATDRFSYGLSVYEGIPVDQHLSYGESVSGELTRDDRYFNDFYVNGYHDAYAVEASVGDEITIEMRPDNEIDNRAQLVLFDPEGDRVAYDTNQNGEDGNAVITQYRIDNQQGGEYTIVATGGGGIDRFSYQLSVYDGIPVDQHLNYGDTIRGQLTRDDRYYSDFYINGYHDAYAFQAKSDNIISIKMGPENENEEYAQLVLFDPDGDRVASDTNQDGKAGNAVLSEHKITKEGKYTIVATGDSHRDLFEYILELTLVEGTPPAGDRPSEINQDLWDAVTGQNEPTDALTYDDLNDAVDAYQNENKINGATITFDDIVSLIKFYHG